MPSHGNIAVFQAYHSLQIHTLNVVKYLRESGYSVDLFLLFQDGIHVQYVNLQENQIFDYSDCSPSWKSQTNILKRNLGALRYYVIEPILSKFLIPNIVLKRTKEQLAKKQYVCFIGVEKNGLVWAGLMGKIFKIPYLYYSLELYTDEYYAFTRPHKRLRFWRTRQLEKRFHPGAHATIVQDEVRGTVLMTMQNIYLPVSIAGKPIFQKSDLLHEKFHISKKKRIILQFGLITGARLSDKIAEAVQHIDNKWVIVFHGAVTEEGIIDRIKKINSNNNIILSTDLIASSLIDEIIESVDIGLCFYDNKVQNDFHTGFSSEKLARYLQCGIPVIAFDYPTFKLSVEKNKCGVCIKGLDELPIAIQKIENDYNRYRENAFKTYRSTFEFKCQFKKVLNFIDHLEA